jgi:DNA-binding MarR family transcriptional regulator
VQLEHAVFHLMRRALQEHGANWQARLPHLTKPQYAVLHAVHEDPGIEQAILGQRAAIDKATLASLLLRMEQRGLVVRKVDAADRRRRLLRLTDAGEAELRATVPVADALNSKMLARLTDNEHRQLLHLLGKLALTNESTVDLC